MAETTTNNQQDAPFDWMSMAEQAQSTGVDLSLQQFLTAVPQANQPQAVATISKGLAANTEEGKSAAFADLQQLVDPKAMSSFLNSYIPQAPGKIAEAQVDPVPAYSPQGIKTVGAAMQTSQAASQQNFQTVAGQVDVANRDLLVKGEADKAKFARDQAILKETEAAEALAEAQNLAKLQAENAGAIRDMEANWGFFDIF